MCQAYLCRHVAIRSRRVRVPACAEIALVGHGDGLEEWREGEGRGGRVERGDEERGGAKVQRLGNMTSAVWHVRRHISAM